MNQPLQPNEIERLKEIHDLHEIFKYWERAQNDPEAIVIRLAEIFELEASK